jgi:hypothetical protein
LIGRLGPNPHWFVYPSLFLYVLLVPYAALFLVGRLLGVFSSPDEFARFYFSQPLLFHLLGRSLILACGLAGIYLTFRLGARRWGKSAGLAAAALIAVSPTHLLYSKLAKPDLLMALLILLAALTLSRYLESERTTSLWLCAALVGLAVSTKYTAILTAPWLVVAPWLHRRSLTSALRAVAALAIALLAFLVGTPFAVLDWPTFSRFFRDMASLMGGSFYGVEGRIGYSYYLWDALPAALGWPAALLAIAGVLMWTIRGNAFERMLALPILASYILLGYSSSATDYYTLPFLPFLALAAASLVLASLSRLPDDRRGRLRRGLGGICAVALLFPAALSARDTLLLGARETRELAGLWIQSNLPPGTRILSEGYAPFLPIAAGRLKEIIDTLEESDRPRGMRLRFEMERSAADPGSGYWLREMEMFSHPYLPRASAREYDLARFRSAGYSIVVLSSGVFARYRRFPERYPIQNRFFDEVTRSGQLMHRVDSTTPWYGARTANQRLAEAAARRWGRPGPVLLIYRLPRAGHRSLREG